MFFVFDGIDGSGKSSQLKLFTKWLEAEGRSVVTCNDPGSTELGDQLRAILLGKHETPIHMRTEMMLFTTARTQLVEQIVRPALDEGKTVVLDRYIMSTVVYQGYGGDLHPDQMWLVNRIATDGLMPDATFILDLPVDVAMKRLGDSRDRMESRGNDYFQKVRDGFLKEAERWPDGVDVIDANRDVESIQTEIQTLAARYIERKKKKANLL